MKFCIIYDCDSEQDEKTIKKFFSSIFAFLNGVLLFSESNKILLINNKQIVFDSEIHEDFNIIFKKSMYPVRTGDIGYALILKPDIIVACTMFKDNLDFNNLLNCIKAASQMNIRIDTFCLEESNGLKLLSNGTNGLFIKNDFQDLLRILYEDKNTNLHTEFNVKCYCCKKDTKIGYCCPICLTIYCKFTPICKKCKIKFNCAK